MTQGTCLNHLPWMKMEKHLEKLQSSWRSFDVEIVYWSIRMCSPQDRRLTCSKWGGHDLGTEKEEGREI